MYNFHQDLQSLNIGDYQVSEITSYQVPNQYDLNPARQCGGGWGWGGRCAWSRCAWGRCSWGRCWSGRCSWGGGGGCAGGGGGCAGGGGGGGGACAGGGTGGEYYVDYYGDYFIF